MGKPVYFAGTSARLSNRSLAPVDQAMLELEASVAPVSLPASARLRYNIGINQFEVSYNGAPYVPLGGGGGNWTVFDLADPGTTVAAINAALALPDKRGVYLYDSAGGGFACALPINVPAGKSLRGANWFGDPGLLPVLVMQSNAQIRVDGEVQGLHVVLDAATMGVGPLIGNLGFAQDLLVTENDGNGLDYYAFEGVWHRITGCSVRGLLGVPYNSSSMDRGYTLLENCDFDGTNPLSHPLPCVDLSTDFVEIWNCRFRNYQYGVQANALAQNCRIDGFSAEYCGYGIYAADSVNLSVNRIYLSTCADAGIYLQDCVNTVITHGIIQRCGDGIFGTNNATILSQLVVDDIRFDACTNIGLHIEFAEKVGLSNLSFVGCVVRSMYVRFVWEQLTVENIIIENGAGALISASEDVTVTNFTSLNTVGLGQTADGLMMNGNYQVVTSNISIQNAAGAAGWDCQSNSYMSGSNIIVTACAVDGIVAGVDSDHFRLDGVQVMDNVGRGIWAQTITSVTELAFLSNVSGTGNGVNPEWGSYGDRWVVELGQHKRISFPAIVATPYAATMADEVLTIDASGGNKVVNLPNNAQLVGKHYYIKKVDASANTVTVNATGGSLIDGLASRVLAAQYACLHLVTDGSVWHLI